MERRTVSLVHGSQFFSYCIGLVKFSGISADIKNNGDARRERAEYGNARPSLGDRETDIGFGWHYKGVRRSKPEVVGQYALSGVYG